MDPQTVFCPNPACLASGRVGAGNIVIHSQKEQRYKCQECGKTFSARQGTALYRAHKTQELIVIVVTLLAYGCPLQAIVAAYGWDERTVARYQAVAGQHCQAVHEHWVERPRDLEQVQADEIRVRCQGFVGGLAMAMQVRTRLWLGATMSRRRDTALIQRLIAHVRAAALCRPLLFCVDGLSTYVGAIRDGFREAIPTGHRGRPHLRPWDGIWIAPVVKQYEGHRVVGVTQRIVQGTAAVIQRLLQTSQGGGQINTAYIERLNATFRSRLAALARRGRATVRQIATLEQAAYLVGTVYNFCTYHQSLAQELVLPRNRRRWLRRTPANAAGITDHLWTVEELLLFKVPHPPVLPKLRGRPSQARRAQLARWGLHHG